MENGLNRERCIEVFNYKSDQIYRKNIVLYVTQSPYLVTTTRQYSIHTGQLKVISPEQNETYIPYSRFNNIHVPEQIFTILIYLIMFTIIALSDTLEMNKAK